MADEGVNVYINAIDNTAAGTASAARNVETLAGKVTSADILMQQQMSRERQVEQMLMQHGVVASPGAAKLSAKQLGGLGLTEAELGQLGMGGAARAGGNQYERVLAGRMAGMGNVANLMGFSGPMVGVGAAALGAGALAAGIGDLVKVYREHEFATRDLTQAYQQAGLDFGSADVGIEKWISSNAAYIDDVNAAREGFAKLTRSGLTQTQVTNAMNDAINLAAIKHISLAQAVEQVDLFTQGNSRGLKDLGIQVKDYTDLTISGAQAQKQVEAANKGVATAAENLTNAQRTLKEDQQRLHDKFYVTENDRMHEQDLIEKVNDAQQKLVDAQNNAKSVQDAVTNRTGEVNKALSDLGGKVKDGTKTVDDLEQAQNRWGATVDKLATDVGPGLLAALSGLVGAIDNTATTLLGASARIDQGLNLGSQFDTVGGHWVGGGHGNPGRWVPNAPNWMGTGTTLSPPGSGFRPKPGGI